MIQLNNSRTFLYRLKQSRILNSLVKKMLSLKSFMRNAAELETNEVPWKKNPNASEIGKHFNNMKNISVINALSYT